MGARLWVEAPVTGSALGLGSSAQWWLERPVAGDFALTTALGFRYLDGYRTGLVAFEEGRHPYEMRQVMCNTQVNTLAYLSADLGLARTVGAHWSFALSGRASWLIGWKGYAEETTMYSLRWIEVAPSGRLVHLNYSGNDLGGSSEPLDGELRGYDLGLQLRVGYRLTEGLRAELAGYRGFVDQWSDVYPGERSFFITSFALGLSVRLF